MALTMNSDARMRLDKHLDAVEAALVAAGNSREQRRGVMDDLEAQIMEMLTARSQTPTVADVEEVLRQLDPPASYVGSVNTAFAAPPLPINVNLPVDDSTPIAARFSRTAIAGLVFIILGLLPPLRIFNDPSDVSSAVFALIGTVLGWVSAYQIRNSGGALRGKGLADFDAFFYIFFVPVEIVWMLFFSHP